MYKYSKCIAPSHTVDSALVKNIAVHNYIIWCPSRAGKNLRFLKKVFRFLGFNIYAQSHAEHWTQEYDQLKSYIHVD